MKENGCSMGVFNDNITNELSLVTKIRAAINETLDSTVDLVNNHFGDTKLNIWECGDWISILPPNTRTSFIHESIDALEKLCESDFGSSCGLCISRIISLEALESTLCDDPDATTKYKVTVTVDFFADGTTIYTDQEFSFIKTLFNQPHWPHEHIR